MTERTKVVILILSQTVVIALDYAIETMLGMSAENDLKFFALILLNLLIYIGFGFFTENAKKLLTYSIVIALINIIFVCSDMYFNLNEYQETLQFFGDSVFILLSFGLTLIFIVSLVFIGAGMFLSHSFKVIFRK